jgi:hypothetical protein
MVIGLQCAIDSMGGVIDCLHHLGPQRAGRLPAGTQPDSDCPDRLQLFLERNQEDRSAAAPPVGDRAAHGIPRRDMRVQGSNGHFGERALRRQHALQQAAVTAAGYADDPNAGAFDRRHHNLRVEGSLQLIGQPEAHAAHRFERGGLRLSLRESHQMRLAPYSIEQPPQIIFHHAEAGGFERVRKEKGDGRTGLGMEDQHASVHPLRPALLLISGPLQSPVHGDDL